VLDGLMTAVSQAVDEAGSAPDRLRGFMLAHARYFEQHNAEFVTMLIGYSGMALTESEEAVERRNAYEKLLRSILEQGVAQGSFRQIDVAMSGRAVLSMLNWMVRWYKSGQKESAEVIAAGYFDLLWGGLRV